MDGQKDFIMPKQFTRSGTSIGAIIHEGLFAQSRADFVSKMSIALKEASETSYWLIVLNKSEFLKEPIYKGNNIAVDPERLRRQPLPSPTQGRGRGGVCNFSPEFD